MMDIHVDTVLDHPRERVWSALTSSEAMAEWLMPNDFRPQVGHRFMFTTDPAPGFDGTVRCEVLEIDEARRLAISWCSGKLDTVVTFTLTDEGAGRTRLAVDHTGFAFRDLIARLVMGPGWKRIARRKLANVLDGSMKRAVDGSAVEVVHGA